jgi:predicted CXXCH cytochrome family protein
MMTFGMVLLSQCSPHAGKSVLRFFFDGVPDTDSSFISGQEQKGLTPDSTTYALGAPASSGPVGFVHYPYGEQECASCHNELSLGNMVEPQPGLCYICHEDLSASYNYLHGPVAGGYCTACHDPHRSENEHLLKLTGEALCFYCHQEQSVLKNEMHLDLEGMLCTDCHNPHGGDDKYIFQ